MKLTLLLIPLLLTACLHKSELKKENGIVVEKQFAPEIDDVAVGMTSGGDMSFSSVHVAEKYLVFFKCDHGVIFHVEDKDLWENLNRQDSVIIEYYDILTRKNKQRDLEFVTAYKK